MSNAFSTSDGYSAFDGLLISTSHMDSKDKGLSRTERDDGNENPVKPWTFQEMQGPN